MTKPRVALLLGVVASVAVLGAGRVRAQEIFLAADAAGATRTIIAPVGVPVTVFILAKPGPLPGITGAEFRVTGLPAGWLAISTPNPAAPVAFGNPFTAPGANIAFASCQAADANGNVLLYTVTITASFSVSNVTLSVQARTPPGNPTFDCPLVTQCAPAFTITCVAAGVARINPVAAPVLGSPFSPGFVALVGILVLVGSLSLLRLQRRRGKAIATRGRQPSRTSLFATMPLLLATYLAPPAQATVVVIDPNQSSCQTTFSQVFTGNFTERAAIRLRDHQPRWSG